MNDDDYDAYIEKYVIGYFKDNRHSFYSVAIDQSYFPSLCPACGVEKFIVIVLSADVKVAFIIIIPYLL